MEAPTSSERSTPMLVATLLRLHFYHGDGDGGVDDGVGVGGIDDDVN